MPNKDSFTFSDKLRKSKSVPLSKRLPSIVGGQNKQKRTLVQRAQRDLPFILVAAGALLLLPFLSKNGTDDIPSPDIAWEQQDPNFPEGPGREIVPADSMEDPMKWIVRPTSDIAEQPVAAAPEPPKRDAVGGEPGGSNPRWKNQPPYNDDWDEPRTGGTKNPPGAQQPGKTGPQQKGPSTGGTRTPTRKQPATTGRTPQRPTGGTKSTGTPSTKSSPEVRKDFDKQMAAKKEAPSAVEKFEKGTKSGVRNSVVRKATEINRALRVSALPGGGTNAGVSHALPIGQQTVRTSAPFVLGPGVRPVALQPMDAKGTVGRSMTGENLYAEAARSINAMNAGRGAKANLLEAQMRDVDGTLTPGADGGTFGGDGTPRAGAGGGGPHNNNGYKVDRPWWWDMMQQRSQKWWDLFQYKWREMLWNNIYDIIFNGGKQIANCLIFGSKDVDVSAMFGKSAGEGDYECPGMMSLGDYVAKYGSSYTRKGKDDETEQNFNSDNARAEWFSKCPKKADGSEGWVYKPGKRKSAWEVRKDCLGIGSIFHKNEYDGLTACDGVNNDPMSYILSITRNGRTIERLEKKSVITLVAQNKSGTGPEAIVYIQNGNVLSREGSNFASKFSLNYPNCELTKLESFVSRRSINQLNTRVKDYVGNAYSDEGLVDLSDGELNSKIKDALHDCATIGLIDGKEYVTRESMRKGQDGVKRTGKNKIDPSQRAARKALDPQDLTYYTCPISADKSRITRLTLNEAVCKEAPKTPICSGKDCDKEERFTAIVENPGKKYVYAFVLEEEKTGGDENSDAVATNNAILRTYFPFNKYNTEHVSKIETNSYKYSFEYDVFNGAGGSNEEDVKKVFKNYNKGRVLWVVTDSDLPVKATNNSSFTKSMEAVTTLDLFGENINAVVKACDYRPPCTGDECAMTSDEVCKDDDNKLFYAMPLVQNGTSYDGPTDGLMIPLDEVNNGFRMRTKQHSITDSPGMEYYDFSKLTKCTKLCYKEYSDRYGTKTEYTSERLIFVKEDKQEKYLGTILQLKEQVPEEILTRIQPCDPNLAYCEHNGLYYNSFPLEVEGTTYIVRKNDTPVELHESHIDKQGIKKCSCFGWKGEDEPIAYLLPKCPDVDDLPTSDYDPNIKKPIDDTQKGLIDLWNRKPELDQEKWPLLPKLIDDDGNNTNGFCKLEGEGKWYKSIILSIGKDTDAHFIIDPNPVDEANVSDKFKQNPPKCYIAVWEDMEGAFIVYNANVNYALDPNNLPMPRPQYLFILSDIDPFLPIKGIAEQSGDPTRYPYFPKLRDPLDEGQIDNICVSASKRVLFDIGKYQNPIIQDPSKLKEEIERCLDEAMAKAKADGKAFDLYLYGFASKECGGESEYGDEGCRVRNLTLSADRARSFVNAVLSKVDDTYKNVMYIDESFLNDLEKALSADKKLKRFPSAPSKCNIKFKGTSETNALINVHLQAAGWDQAGTDDRMERFVILTTMDSGTSPADIRGQLPQETADLDGVPNDDFDNPKA